MNKAILMGRLTADPEMRTTPNGTAVARFNLAVRRKYAKEGQQDTDFINCIAWRTTAEFICKYFRKGSMIAVVGSIQTGSYEKDGRKIYTTDVLVDEAYFTGSKAESGTGTDAFETAGFTSSERFNDDDMPF